MSRADRKQQLFEDIVRLRRAERTCSAPRDIVTVRSHLEQELGDSVSRSLAARLLGVSHTGLQRWIDAGDVPVVLTRSGRQEVPISALVDLYESTETVRSSGRRRLHVMEPTLVAARTRASTLDASKLLSPTDMASADPHDRAERRSRAYHAAVARTLRRDTVRDALHQLWRWNEEGKIDPRYAEEWETVLGRPIPEIKQVLTEDSQWARDLRQNSPFAGALSEPERRKIFDTIR
ncbi:MerR family transcriptional regulator [Capillimicrobium parvum]|uniref:Helix-turn-helix domain-containing protein n=1 Tax=Capillimicrobium parvum TaxID=2884022 RepID=A0A9E6XZR5_9ACTN|nr:hypothetical protein [Capillimicrobium parvum]UGS36771.1 hypothetical protein DSM104329_03181 [Capillimicrobium parvum]